MTHNVMTYDKAYFIAKFEAIPEGRWTTGRYRARGQCCALGHCGADYDLSEMVTSHTPESRALVALFSSSAEVTHINDGTTHNARTTTFAHLPTPKQRILAALRSL